MKQDIKQWYISAFPTDDLGNEIREDITFLDVFELLVCGRGGSVYDLLDVYDSVIRERIFERIAELLDVEYNYVYKMWLEGSDYLNVVFERIC